MLSGDERKSKKRPFTLLEVCVCIAIVALISGFLGIKIVDSIGYHRFSRNVTGLVSELKRMQGFAMSYRSEFGLKIDQDKEGVFGYTLFSDEPIPLIENYKRHDLKEVTEIIKDKKSVKELSLSILPSGKIEPASIIKIQHKTSTLSIDLRAPLQIKIGESYAEEA